MRRIERKWAPREGRCTDCICKMSGCCIHLCIFGAQEALYCLSYDNGEKLISANIVLLQFAFAIYFIYIPNGNASCIWLCAYAYICFVLALISTHTISVYNVKYVNVWVCLPTHIYTIFYLGLIYASILTHFSCFHCLKMLFILDSFWNWKIQSEISIASMHSDQKRNIAPHFRSIFLVHFHFKFME